MSTISELKKQPTGFPVIDLRATITGIKKQKVGTGQYGPYSFQDITLSDGQQSIVAKLSNWPELTEKDLDTSVYLSCYKNKDGKLVGAILADDKYAGQVIKVSKTAKFEPLTEEPPVKVETPKVEEITPKKPVSGDQDEKYRSMAIAYAKDLVIARMVDIVDLYAFADKIVKYISSGEVINLDIPLTEEVICKESEEEIPF